MAYCLQLRARNSSRLFSEVSALLSASAGSWNWEIGGEGFVEEFVHLEIEGSRFSAPEFLRAKRNEVKRAVKLSQKLH